MAGVLNARRTAGQRCRMYFQKWAESFLLIVSHFIFFRCAAQGQA
jgi:hypothetical protein